MRSLRWTKYSEDYLNYLHNRYKDDIKCLTCTYYNLDVENSVCDKDKLFNGTWEYVGEWSGYKWKKIELFPVNFITDPVSLNVNSNEKGNNVSLNLSAVIPSSYNIVPNGLDFLIFDSNILFPSINKQTTFVVVGQNKSNIGDKLFYQFSLKNIYIDTKQLDLQSDEYIFIEYEKSIFQKNIAIDMLKILDNEQRLYELLKTKYQNSRGFYYL